MKKAVRWMSIVTGLLVTAAAISFFSPVIDADVRRCCLRTALTADAASAQLQQDLAHAVVRNGARLTELRAPRPTNFDRPYWQTVELGFDGTDEAVLGALDQFTQLNPGVLIWSVRVIRNEPGALRAHLRVLQVVHISRVG